MPAIAPSEIYLEYDEGHMRYEEVLDLSVVPEERREDVVERTRHGAAAFGSPTAEVDVHHDGDTLTVKYVDTTEDAAQALSGATAELLMALKQMGGDINHPWHTAHVMIPGPGRPPEGVR